MKQTPIPEKINHIDVESNPFVSIILLAQLTGNLIDVLTEQQDRLDRHNNRIEETNKHFGNKIKDLQKEIERDNKYFTRLFEELTECIQLIQTQVDEQSYTAMRSTGDVKYCPKCELAMIGECPYHNPIKPQEDSENSLFNKIAELQMDDRPEIKHYLISKEYTKGFNDAVRKILAIVKGE